MRSVRASRRGSVGSPCINDSICIMSRRAPPAQHLPNTSPTPAQHQPNTSPTPAQAKCHRRSHVGSLDRLGQKGPPCHEGDLSSLLRPRQALVFTVVVVARTTQKATEHNSSVSSGPDSCADLLGVVTAACSHTGRMFKDVGPHYDL